MSTSRLARLILACLLILVLVSACSDDGWRPRRWRLPSRGPVDVFEDIIGQVSRLGEGIARQFRGMTGPRR